MEPNGTTVRFTGRIYSVRIFVLRDDDNDDDNHDTEDGDDNDETIWDHMKPYGIIRDHLGPSGIMWDHMGPYRA